MSPKFLSLSVFTMHANWVISKLTYLKLRPNIEWMQDSNLSENY